MCRSKGKSFRKDQMRTSDTIEANTQTLPDITSVFVDDCLSIIPDTAQNDGESIIIEPTDNRNKLKCTIQIGISLNHLSLSLLTTLNLISLFKP